MEKGIARFAVLPDERGLLLGKDLGGMFEPGYVYQVEVWVDSYVIRKVGKYYLAPKGAQVSELSDANSIIRSGLHLITMEEAKTMNND